MQVVAFVGFMGSGKDTAARYVVENHGFTPIAFADTLKDAVAAIFGWDRELLAGSSGESRRWREEVDPWWAEKLGKPNLTPRWVLQNMGTEVMRRHFHPSIWLMAVERRMRASGQDKFVITDARFPNEVEFVHGLGGKVVRVRRGPEPEWYSLALSINKPEDPRVERLFNHRLRETLVGEYKVHESEWAWIGQDFDALIENDGSLDDLYARTQQTLGALPLATAP